MFKKSVAEQSGSFMMAECRFSHLIVVMCFRQQTAKDQMRDLEGAQNRDV